MTAEAIRRVHVEVLSAGVELGNVLRLSMVIVVGVWMYAASDGAASRHHRLLTGVTLHVSTWVHTNGGHLGARIVRSPQAEGWTQLYAVGPSVSARRKVGAR